MYQALFKTVVHKIWLPSIQPVNMDGNMSNCQSSEFSSIEFRLCLNFKAKMNICKLYKTVAIFSSEPLSKTGYYLDVSHDWFDLQWLT